MAASLAFPVMAPAQPMGGPGEGGPPPAMRAKMEKILGDARAAAMNALSPGHRDAVAAIVAQNAAGTLDRRAGAQRIDALLTSDERSRVLAVERKLRTDMRALMPGGGLPPGGGPPPGAGPPGGPPPGAPGFAGRAPDPGRFLLMIAQARRSHGPEPRSSAAQ